MGYGNGLSLVKILDLPSTLIIPLMVLLGILFCITALVGYKGLGNDSNLLIVFYVQIMPDDFVMQLHRF